MTKKMTVKIAIAFSVAMLVATSLLVSSSNETTFTKPNFSTMDLLNKSITTNSCCGG